MQGWRGPGRAAVDGYLTVALIGEELDGAVVGSKAAALDRLIGAGFPVPDTIVVTTDAYRRFIEEAGLASFVEEVRARPMTPPQLAIEEFSRVEKAFLDAPLPRSVGSVLSALVEDSTGPYAVRSSASAEDLAGASFAGQYLTVLDVTDFEGMARAVRRVWASLWHPWARAYRRQMGILEADLAMAVILQPVVPADSSGVVFTVDPVWADVLRLEVVPGLGEGLVSGKVTPDVYQLRRPGLQSVEEGVVDPVIRRAAHLAVRIEERLDGTPQDVEWSAVGDEVWVLQARPITTLDLTADDASDGFDTTTEPGASLISAGVEEMLPGVLTPLLWTINAPMIEDAFRQLFDKLGALPTELDGPFAFLVRDHGRAHLNLSVIRYAAEAAGGWSSQDVEHLYLGTDPSEAQAGGTGLRAWLQRLRAFRVRRKAMFDAEAFTRVVESVAQLNVDARELVDAELVAYRWRLRDMAATGVRAEIMVGTAAVTAYQTLEAMLRRWIGEEASSWAQTLTREAGRLPNSPRRIAERLLAELREEEASLSESDDENWIDPEVFTGRLMQELDGLGSAAIYAGPTWGQRGDAVVDLASVARPRDAAGPTEPSAAEDLHRLERRLTRSWKWRLTRLITGQAVDVRRRLLRRMVADAGGLLNLRERAKAALLELGGGEQRVILEAGRRLSDRGQLEFPGDVELLADWELDDILLRASDVDPAVIEHRRLVLERWRSKPTPRVGGASALEEGAGLTGWGASPGVHRGPVGVILDPAQAVDLEPGFVLVAPATDPSWTDVFGYAGALVIERGGPLSHAAILAREFGIPAVLNVEGATSALDEGVWVEVDGTRGVVTVLRSTREQRDQIPAERSAGHQEVG